MRVVLDYYFDDLEARCTNPECPVDVLAGPYSDEPRNCWRCNRRPTYFRAFGTAEQRSEPVRREAAYVVGGDL